MNYMHFRLSTSYNQDISYNQDSRDLTDFHKTAETYWYFHLKS